MRDFCKALSPTTGVVQGNFDEPVQRTLSRTQNWAFGNPDDGGLISPTSWLASLGRTAIYCATGGFGGGRDAAISSPEDGATATPLNAEPQPPRPPPRPLGQPQQQQARRPPVLPLWIDNR